MNNRYCIIMAGGIGSRFWPLSKNNYPKQFLDILGTGKSFIRSTFERFLPVVPAENFLVVTNAAYKAMVLEHLPELKPDQVLCEPMRRNTAPCIAYANYRILSRTPEASIVVTPADHLVTNEVEFQRIIRVGMDFVEDPAHRDALLTIGIKPSRPETGYGYIEVSDPSAATAKAEVLPVVNFREKPDLETAKQYLAAGRYLWNAGIFVWSLQGIRNAYHDYLPAMEQLFDQGRSLFGTEKEQAFIDGMFAQCENISIDYGVMERSPNRFTLAVATSAPGVPSTSTPPTTPPRMPSAATLCWRIPVAASSISSPAMRPSCRVWSIALWPCATTACWCAASTTSRTSSTG